MKRCLVLIICLFSLAVVTGQSIPSADAVLKTAYQKAARENKNVFLLFHASWCGWCRDMDSTMQEPALKPYFDKYYVITHLTVYERENKKHLENAGALEFLTAHGGADQGIPFWMILDPSGKKLADSQRKPGANSGRPTTKEEVAHFVAVLEKTSAITAEQKSIVVKKFTSE